MEVSSSTLKSSSDYSDADDRGDVSDRVVASAHHQLLQMSERDSFLKELTKQNDLILSEHKKILDIQFQQQMRSVMDKFKGELRRTKSDLFGSSYPLGHMQGGGSGGVGGGGGVSIPDLERSNEKFYEAARRTHTAPQFNLYDGNNERTTVIRASSSNSASECGNMSAPSRSLKTSTTYNNNSISDSYLRAGNSSSSSRANRSRNSKRHTKRHTALDDFGDDFYEAPSAFSHVNTRHIDRGDIGERGDMANRKQEAASGGGLSRQLKNIYGIKALPHLKREFSTSPKRESPTFPTLLAEKSEKDRNEKNEKKEEKERGDGGDIRKLDPSLRDFLSKTESMLIDARKIKKKVKRKTSERDGSQERDGKEGSEEENGKEHYYENYGSQGNQENRVNFAEDLYNASSSLPAISERRTKTPNTPSHPSHPSHPLHSSHSSHIDNRISTAYITDSRDRMRTQLSSSPILGKNEKKSANNDVHDSHGKLDTSDKHDNHVIHEKLGKLPTRADSNSSDQVKSRVLEGEEFEAQKLKDLGWTGSSYEGERSEEHQGEYSLDHGRSPKNESSHTTVEWQNELARHILSMYATTTANTNMSNSKAILEFVDGTGYMTADSLSNESFIGWKDRKDRNNSAKDSRNTGNNTGMKSRGGDLDESGSQASLKSDLSSLKSIKSDSKAPRDERKNKENITIIRDFSTISPSRSLAGSTNLSLADSKVGSNRKNRSNNRNDSNSNDGNISVVTGAMSSSSNKNRSNTPQNERLVNGEAYLRLNGPPRCFPVWFVGTGDVYSDWSPLMGGMEGAKLQAQLKVFYEHREFKEYLQVVETLLNRFLKDLIAAEIRNSSRSVNKHYSTEESSASLNSLQVEEEDRLMGERKKLSVFWLQLVTTGVAMASLSIDSKRFDLALNILQRSQEWSTRDDVLQPRQCQSCRGHVYDTYSYFFFRRKKLTAALHHADLAKNLHSKLDNYDGLAGTLLHIAAIQCQQSRHTEAHKAERLYTPNPLLNLRPSTSLHHVVTLYHFLAMVEDGRLEFKTASPTQLCLVAVGYHNLAVIQIKLQASDLACKTSQNARKIARLCLSASTRYLSVFQRTHEAALADLKYHMEYRPVAAGYISEIATYDNNKFDVVNSLVENLFNTIADIDSTIP